MVSVMSADSLAIYSRFRRQRGEVYVISGESWRQSIVLGTTAVADCCCDSQGLVLGHVALHSLPELLREVPGQVLPTDP